MQNHAHPSKLLYKKLMTFISKNRTIPTFFEQVKGIDNLEVNTEFKTGIQELKTAIRSAQSDHPIFKNINCPLYLLYLIERNKISDTEAITVFIYLMALKSEYNNITIIDINKNDDPTFNKDAFITKLINKASINQRKIDAHTIREQIDKLQGINAWIIITDHAHEPLERIFLKNNIFLGSGPCLDSTEKNYFIPSIEIMNLFLLQINPRPIRFYPIQGLLSSITLLYLHTLGYHPLQIYNAPFVRDNLTTAHNFDLSPLAMVLHDIYHVFSGSLLTSEEHRYLFHDLIPEINAFIDKLIINNLGSENTNFIKTLKGVVTQLADMDLGLYAVNIHAAKPAESLFSNWLEYTVQTANDIRLENFHLLTNAIEIKTILQFYYLLYSSSSPTLIKLFSGFIPSISSSMKKLFSKEENASSQNNMLVIEKLFMNAHHSLLRKFLYLLQSSNTADEFITNLSSETYCSLYYQLLEAGFLHIPTISCFTNENFNEIKKMEAWLHTKVINLESDSTRLTAPQEHLTNYSPSPFRLNRI